MHRTARFVAVIAATSVLAAPAFAETTADWSKYRHAVMDAMKGHIAAVAMVSFGQVEDTGHLQDHADGLAKAAAELKSLFPAGSGEGSHALPAIWSEPDKFAAAVTAAEKGTAALRDAACKAATARQSRQPSSRPVIPARVATRVSAKNTRTTEAMAPRLWLAVALLATASIATAQQNAIQRGRYLVQAGGCISCHTAEGDDATRLAGGRALESPFGTFYSPNITPDRDTGIGAWTDEEFLNAFWEGVGPDGKYYFPAFPYTSYTGITREDLLAIKAYLFSIEPSRKPNRDHELPWYLDTRLAAAAWQLLKFDAGRFRA